METIKVRTKDVRGLRLDFPTDRQLAALVPAWTDGLNHQICFIDEKKLGRTEKLSEYSSMVASADLILPETVSLIRKTLDSRGKSPAFGLHEIAVPQSQEEYLSLFPLEDEEETPQREYTPLRTLDILMSALEQRNGTIFMIGGTTPALQRAERNLKSTFPRLRLVGRSPGNYLPQEEAALMTALQKTSPDLFLVGSLVAGGELWVPRHMNYTRSGIFFFDDSIIEVLAGSH